MVHISNLNFDFSLNKVANSRIGDINLTILNAFIYVFKGVIVLLVQAVFAAGIHLGWILKFLGLDIIDLDKASLTPHNQYFVV